MTATVIAVEARSLRVTVKMFGRTTETTIDVADFQPDGTEPAASEDSPFRPGDVVLVHHAVLHEEWLGRELVVQRVDETTRVVTVDSSLGSQGILFDDITLVAPLRRDPLPDYVAALRRVEPLLGHQEPLQAWCIEKLSERDWDLDDPDFDEGGALAEEYVALETVAWNECAAALKARIADFHRSFDPLTVAERVDSWRTNWRRWVDWRTLNAEREAREAPSRYVESRRLAREGDIDEQLERARLWNALRQRFEKRPWRF